MELLEHIMYMQLLTRTCVAVLCARWSDSLHAALSPLGLAWNHLGLKKQGFAVDEAANGEEVPTY